MPRIIVIMGAPGAGKGTQARLIAEKSGYPQISTGDILREIAQQETPLGREIKEIQASGRLVSDEVLADVIRERTSRPDCARGYILDGYPRTLNQAELLEELAKEQGKEVKLIKLVVPFESLMKRLTGRRTCSQCGEIYNLYLRPPRREGVCDLDGGLLSHRADDNPETVRARLETYEQTTAPVVDYYRQSGRLIEINGELSVEEVAREISSALGCN